MFLLSTRRIPLALVSYHLTLLALSCNVMTKLGNFCTVPSHNSSSVAGMASYAEDPDLVERLNAVSPSKDFRSGALDIEGGVMLETAFTRVEMAVESYALVSTMLRILVRSERSVEILTL